VELSRRHLLGGSALLLTPARALLSSALASEPVPTPAAAGKPIILCWNENPYGPSPAARAAIAQTIGHACRYPDDADLERLGTRLAQREGVSRDHIVLGTGSGELLRALGLRCARVSGELLAAEPTYGELPEYARESGVTVRFVPVDAMLRHDLAAMHAAVTPRIRAVYLCNPNNPTGTALTAREIGAFVDALPQDVLTIVDEAYMDFTDAPGVRSVSELVKTGKRVIVLRTFSKIHGMAGVRCGYGIAPADLASELAGLCMTSPNIFAMRAAVASLDDHAFLSDCRRRILASRARIKSELGELGLRYADPQGNFVFFDTGVPLAQFSQYMQRERGILVGRRFPPYDTWCRITIGTEPEVDNFLESLHAWRGTRRESA